MHIITKIWVLASLKQYEITSKDHTKSCQSAKKIQVKLGFLVSSSLIFFCKKWTFKTMRARFPFFKFSISWGGNWSNGLWDNFWLSKIAARLRRQLLRASQTEINLSDLIKEQKITGSSHILSLMFLLFWRCHLFDFFCKLPFESRTPEKKVGDYVTKSIPYK